MATTTLSPAIVEHLDRTAAQAQSTHRVPGLLAGVARRGKLLWHTGIGSADLDSPGVSHTADTRFQVASNTKTFTAVMIMQLRDEGRLDLDDPLGAHLPDIAHDTVTVRRLLSHTTGMQREPVGDVWDTLEFPDRDGLITSWNQAQSILPTGTYWHYSNLGYAMLGEVIARLDGREWGESLQARLLDPLGLSRTGLKPQAPEAGCYYVPPYTDVPILEPVVEKKACSAAGSIRSTLTDMVAWHAFLADPDPQVLSPDSVEEMCQPQVLADPAGWTQAWGLGLQLLRTDGQTWVGHTGGLPGSITGFFTHRSSGTTGALAANDSAFPGPGMLAAELGAHVLANAPEPPAAWLPGTTVPPQLLPLLGQWFSEGSGFTFSVRAGHLEARMDATPTAAPSVFEAVGTDAFTTVSGRERGEQLVIRRRPDGSIRQLNWATYRFTREPLGFGDRAD